MRVSLIKRISPTDGEKILNGKGKLSDRQFEVLKNFAVLHWLVFVSLLIVIVLWIFVLDDLIVDRQYGFVPYILTVMSIIQWRKSWVFQNIVKFPEVKRSHTGRLYAKFASRNRKIHDVIGVKSGELNFEFIVTRDQYQCIHEQAWMGCVHFLGTDIYLFSDLQSEVPS